LGAAALHLRNDAQQLLALAAVRDGDEHVARLDHAEVAVVGLGRMQEIRRRAGAGKRGGDLARDVARLADAAHHHTTAALADQGERAQEALVDARDERLDRRGLDREHAARELERGFPAALLGALFRASFRFRRCPYHPGEYSPWTTPSFRCSRC